MYASNAVALGKSTCASLGMLGRFDDPDPQSPPQKGWSAIPSNTNTGPANDEVGGNPVMVRSSPVVTGCLLRSAHSARPIS
ncbi:unnamed protein product [Periconia digitata]|uniref:Uncharacterized protein n=1 Tax=Periconia digitata TaxID=1303443 RepID=A0A9W4UHP2_9PLEO|nr:unnamed protein product [Periconia digitata]